VIKVTVTKAKEFYEKYERFLVPAFLLIGFLLDVITFKSLQIETTFIILGVYAFVAGASIIYTSFYDGRKTPPQNIVLRYLRIGMPLLSQLALGSMLSSALLFYWFSGSLSASWPILVFVAILMVTSEVFRHIYLRPTVQIGFYAFILFSYFSILFPFLFTSLSAFVFLLGGTASYFIMLAIVSVLRYVSETAAQKKRRMFAAVTLVFFGMNALYFLNVIPPLPLAIRDAGVYYSVRRNWDGYTLVGDKEVFPANILPGQTLKSPADGTLYVYTEIFAPANLSTTIYHRWEYKDQATGKWTTRARPSFLLYGGRLPGYRGYTRNTHVSAGSWRVTVETERGQSLGRIPFTVVE
jgi:hypothetical protein